MRARSNARPAGDVREEDDAVDGPAEAGGRGLELGHGGGGGAASVYAPPRQRYRAASRRSAQAP